MHFYSIRTKVFQTYAELYLKHPRLVVGNIIVTDSRERLVDFNHSKMSLFRGELKLGILEVSCCIKKASLEEPIDIPSFIAMKNFRHRNAVMMECLYKEGNQCRLVLSPVDGTLKGWTLQNGLNKLFKYKDGGTGFTVLYRGILM